MFGKTGFVKKHRANGGRGGIRTHGTVARSLDFESSAFDRAQPPFRTALSVGEGGGGLNSIR